MSMKGSHKTKTNIFLCVFVCKSVATYRLNCKKDKVIKSVIVLKTFKYILKHVSCLILKEVALWISLVFRSDQRDCVSFSALCTFADTQWIGIISTQVWRDIWKKCSHVWCVWLEKRGRRRLKNSRLTSSHLSRFDTARLPNNKATKRRETNIHIVFSFTPLSLLSLFALYLFQIPEDQATIAHIMQSRGVKLYPDV